MIVKTITMISLCIAAVSWSTYADSGEEEEFQVYINADSINNRYVRELVEQLNKDLDGKPLLKLNETALNAVKGRMYLAVVFDQISSNYLVKVIDIKSKNKIEDDSNESDSGSFGF